MVMEGVGGNRAGGRGGGRDVVNIWMPWCSGVIVIRMFRTRGA